jgi:hypothetical protein
MRPPIGAVIAFLLLTLANRKRIDWMLVLGWAGVAIALSIVLLLLTLR